DLAAGPPVFGGWCLAGRVHRLTASPVGPCAVNCPTPGVSVGSPYFAAMSAKPVVFELRRRNVPARHTPIVSVLSAFQSPTTGVSAGSPYTTTVELPAPSRR